MSLSNKAVFIVMTLLALSGCSLLEIKLESGIEPLPQSQLNMRVFSRDFSNTFYSGVEQTADQIALNDENNILIKSNTLMWKISSEQGVQRVIFQASPVAAMVDTWTFTAQMSAFFESGQGKTLFGEHQALAIDTSKQLLDNFERTIKGFVTADEFEKYQAFVMEYVVLNPLHDINFVRKSAFNDWLSFRKINEFEAVTTFGSVPEVMSDISDRMAMIAEQTPKILGWKAELYALHSNINVDDIQATLASISDTSSQLHRLMEQSPEMMHSLAKDLSRELSPLIDQLNTSADAKLMQLSAERQAIGLMVKNERMALEDMIARERVAAAADLNEISKHTVEVVFQELTKTLKSMILYFVLFLFVIFFAPLGLGVWLGKRMNLKANMSK